MFCKSLLPITISIIALSVPAQAEFVIEEIVVTAQKREQSMQDVGITMNAFSGEIIENMGLIVSNDLATITPNLSITNPTGEGGTPAVVIRGVGLSDFSVTNQPPIGIYIDEVAVGNANGQVVTLLDVERVEVLKGPQGTLYGRNTTGGALNIISRKPSTETEGSIKLTAAEYGIQKVEAMLSGALTDNLQGRLAVSNYHADGWQENTTFDSEVEKNVFAARGVLAWQPNSNTRVHLTLRNARNDSDADLYGATTDSDFYKNGSEFEPKLNVDTSGATIKVEWDVSDTMTLTSITGYDDLDKLHEEDADMLPTDVIVTRYEADTHTFSQELRLQGETGAYTWIGGLFYGRDLINAETYLNLISKAGEWIYDIRQDVVTSAAFGQLEFNIVEDIRLTLGLRVTHDTVEFEDRAGYRDQGLGLSPGMDSLTDGSFTYFSDFNGVFGPTNNMIDASGLYNDDISNTELSGKVGLDWNLSESTMLYASLSRGYKSGAFPGNYIFNPAALQEYDKEVLTAYELGVKSDLFGNRVRLNAALFWYDYKDAQVFNASDDPILGLAVNRVVNLDVDVWGADMDVTWQPIDALRIKLAAGFTKSEYAEDLNDVISGTEQIKGNQLQNAPELSGSLMVSYEWLLTHSAIRVQLDATYLDDTYFTPNEDISVGQEAYSLINARLSWRNTDESWEVAVWGKNLEDKEYVTYVYDLQSFLGANELMRGMPKTLGVDFKYKF